MVFGGGKKQGGYQTMSDGDDSSSRDASKEPFSNPGATSNVNIDEEEVIIEEEESDDDAEEIEIVTDDDMDDEKSYEEEIIVEDENENDDDSGDVENLTKHSRMSRASEATRDPPGSSRQVAPAPPEEVSPQDNKNTPQMVPEPSSSETKGNSKNVEEANEDAWLSSMTGLVTLGVLIFLALSAIVVGTGLGVAKPFEDDDAPAPSPTSVPITEFPTFSPVEMSPEDDELIALWETVVGDVVREEGTPYNEAAQWMLFRDPSRESRRHLRYLQADPPSYTDSELDYIQRYLLVFLWFASTDNGREGWKSCNPIRPTFTEEACDYQKAIRKLPDGSIQFETIPWTRWLSGADECDWAGVTCSTTSEGRLTVTAIDLGGQGLESPMESLVELTKLVDLKSLKLPWNTIRGGLLPELNSLVELDLTENFVQGQLIALNDLSTLILEGNFLTGVLPVALFKFNSPLKHLNVGRNLLQGVIPAEASFGVQMTTLQLHSNRLDGSIPPELGQLPLRSFKADGNSFNGPLPFDALNARWYDTLEELWLFDNQFTGSIPAVLGSASRLLDLRFSDNNIAGEIPAEIYGLSRLFRLELANNNISGGLSISLVSQLTDLETIDLSGNQLEGRILLDSRLTKLQEVHLEFNQFIGNVPQSLCGIPSLDKLTADCLPADNPPNPCACCTACCSRTTGQCTDGSGNPLPPTTEAPASAPSASLLELVQQWARETFGDDIDQSNGSPHALASVWISNVDSIGLTPVDSTFLQRYVLALFYFSTRVWKSCNPGSSNTCLYQKLVLDENGNISYDLIPETRFLSGVSECEWVGITCLFGSVIGIELPGQEIDGPLPPELATLPLENVDLSYNRLTGEIPQEYESLDSLVEFNIQVNDLEGAIPNEFCQGAIIDVLEADCDEVFCPCCTQCF